MHTLSLTTSHQLYCFVLVPLVDQYTITYNTWKYAMFHFCKTSHRQSYHYVLHRDCAECGMQKREWVWSWHLCHISSSGTYSVPQIDQAYIPRLLEACSAGNLIAFALELTDQWLCMVSLAREANGTYAGSLRITIGTSTPTMHCFLFSTRWPTSPLAKTVKLAKIQAS